jgi:hemolysin III
MIATPAPAPVPSAHPGFSPREELASGAVHGLGALLSVAGLAIMIALASPGGGPRLASALVFGVGLLMLYTASALHHLVSASRLKEALRIADHLCIYVLIAATYTPFALVTLRGRYGWWLFGVIWTLALAGVIAEAAWVHRPRWLAVTVYVTMGWTFIVAGRPLFGRLPRGGLALLVGGGVIYTLGTVFYLLHRVRFMHSVWHAFVLGGSICHFFAVAVYVL